MNLRRETAVVSTVVSTSVVAYRQIRRCRDGGEADAAALQPWQQRASLHWDAFPLQLQYTHRLSGFFSRALSPLPPPRCHLGQVPLS